jgi:hypothetical protein
LLIYDRGQKPAEMDIKLPDEGNVYKNIIFKNDIPEYSLKSGWVAYGDAGNEYEGDVKKDEFSRRDYLSNITFYNRAKNQEVRAVRQDDGTYKTPYGTLKLPEILKFGATREFKIDPVKAL